MIIFPSSKIADLQDAVEAVDSQGRYALPQTLAEPPAFVEAEFVKIGTLVSEAVSGLYNGVRCSRGPDGGWVENDAVRVRSADGESLTVAAKYIAKRTGTVSDVPEYTAQQFTPAYVPPAAWASKLTITGYNGDDPTVDDTGLYVAYDFITSTNIHSYLDFDKKHFHLYSPGGEHVSVKIQPASLDRPVGGVDRLSQAFEGEKAFNNRVFVRCDHAHAGTVGVGTLLPDANTWVEIGALAPYEAGVRIYAGGEIDHTAVGFSMRLWTGESWDALPGKWGALPGGGVVSGGIVTTLPTTSGLDGTYPT